MEWSFLDGGARKVGAVVGTCPFDSQSGIRANCISGGGKVIGWMMAGVVLLFLCYLSLTPSLLSAHNQVVGTY